MSEIVTVVNQWSTNQPLPVGKSPCWEIEIVGNVFRESWTPLLRAPRCALTVTPTGRGYVMGNAIAFAATLAAAPPSDELHTTPGAVRPPRRRLPLGEGGWAVGRATDQAEAMPPQGGSSRSRQERHLHDHAAATGLRQPSWAAGPQVKSRASQLRLYV